MTYTHKKCGGEIFVKSLVHEYATLSNLSDECIEAGDVVESVVEETVLFCEECGKEVSRQDAEEE